MAALSEPRTLTLIDLRRLRVEDLDPLLEEEIACWHTQLDWDFHPSADLVRRFVRMQALSGYALFDARRLVGYAYYVCEERKGLIGDVYVRRDLLAAGHEGLLLDAVLRDVIANPNVARVESQLMMLSEEGWRRLPRRDLLSLFRRVFLMKEIDARNPLPSGFRTPRVVFENWHEREQEQVARLIARSYQGHIDAEINDQYRSIAGGRRFLMNIVQYPGCGGFFQPGSFVATDPVTNQVVGISLASLVAFDVGHITQICVDPAHKGQGIGYELLRRSLAALERGGCRRVSLTVTKANTEAIRLYDRTGFRQAGEFDAFVWQGFSS